MKSCLICKKIKFLEEFHKEKKSKDGAHSWCQECTKNYAKNWRLNNPEKVKANNKKLTKEYRQNHELQRHFGITLEQYKKKFNEQNGFCAICHKPESAKNKSLSVDHDHATNKIRDLICGKHNMALGLVDESIEVLQNMIDYLKKWNNLC